LYSLREWMDFVDPGPYYSYLTSLIGLNIFHFTGLAAALFLVKVIHSERLQRWLSIRPLVFLGKISYGLYIVHWYFIFNVLQHYYWGWKDKFHLSDQKTHLLIGLAVLILSLIAATALHYLVEKPFIQIGRKVAGRVRQRFA